MWPLEVEAVGLPWPQKGHQDWRLPPTVVPVASDLAGVGTDTRAKVGCSKELYSPPPKALAAQQDLKPPVRWLALVPKACPSRGKTCSFRWNCSETPLQPCLGT